MRTLSVQQPWAYAIVHGTKRVENRAWYTDYRGPLLIHAGKTYQTGVEYEIHADSPEVDIEGMRRSTRGAVVGVCQIVACVRAHAVAPDQRIWAGGPWCFVLEDVRALAIPIPFRGQLGFFDVPDSLLPRDILS